MMTSPVFHSFKRNCLFHRCFRRRLHAQRHGGIDAIADDSAGSAEHGEVVSHRLGETERGTASIDEHVCLADELQQRHLLIDDLQGLEFSLSEGNKAMEAFELLSKINATGLKHGVDIHKKVLDLLLSSGHLTQALQLFDQMKRLSIADLSSHLSLVKGLYIAGHLHDACAHFQNMVQRGFGLQMVTLNPLIDELCKLGKWQAAHLILTKLCELGHVPCTATYNIFFSSLCHAGLMQQACSLLEVMTKVGSSPDVYTYGIMVYTLCKAGKINEAHALLKAMKNRQCAPDVVCYSTVLHGYVRAGRLKSAVEFMEEMFKDGCTPDVVTYNSLLSMFCKQGEMQSALRIWKDMQVNGCVPDKISYTALLDGMCRLHYVKGCLELLLEMAHKRIELDAPIHKKVRDCIESYGPDAHNEPLLVNLRKTV